MKEEVFILSVAKDRIEHMNKELKMIEWFKLQL